MFQNIQEETENETKEETSKKKNILTNSLSKKYIRFSSFLFLFIIKPICIKFFHFLRGIFL